jgi:hypothetical protein
MYVVENSLWIHVASMHFEGSAARWLQSVEHRISSLSWGELCSLLHDHFGRDQHEVLIRQMFYIRQVGLVADYVEHFSVLVDQLAAYEATDNLLHYAMRFIDVLKDDIRPMVMIQRPSTLDSACALALVQEEALDSHKKKDTRRYESTLSRVTHRPAYPLPVPPNLDKGASSSAAEDRRGSDPTKAVATDDKLRALRQYRRARGLCEKCAKKWFNGHKCAPNVQLHIIEELWDLSYDTDVVDDQSKSEASSDENGHL